VRRIKGDLKERLKHDPIQVFDGIADQVDLPYGDRVIGIGDFAFSPTPRPQFAESELAKLGQGETAGGLRPLQDDVAEGEVSGGGDGHAGGTENSGVPPVTDACTATPQ